MTLVEAAGLAGSPDPAFSAHRERQRKAAVEVLWHTVESIRVVWYLHTFQQDARSRTILKVLQTFPKSFQADAQVEQYLRLLVNGRARDEMRHQLTYAAEEPPEMPAPPRTPDPDGAILQAQAAASVRLRHATHPVIAELKLRDLLEWVFEATNDELRDYLQRERGRAELRALLGPDQHRTFDDLCDCSDKLTTIAQLAPDGREQAAAVRARQTRLRHKLAGLIAQVSDIDDRARLATELRGLMQRDRKAP
jgi:hypothetical protein